MHKDPDGAGAAAVYLGLRLPFVAERELGAKEPERNTHGQMHSMGNSVAVAYVQNDPHKSNLNSSGPHCRRPEFRAPFTLHHLLE